MAKLINYLTIKSRKYIWKSLIHYKYPAKELLFSKPVAIFGAATMGKTFLKEMISAGMHVSYFVDNNTSLHGKVINKVPVISLSEAKKILRLNPIVVASLSHETEIYTNLFTEGFQSVFPLVYLNMLYPNVFISPEYNNIFESIFYRNNYIKIRIAMDLLKDQESKDVFLKLILFRLTFEKEYLHNANARTSPYHCDNLFKFKENEIFADGGAYTGDSIEDFLKTTHGKYSSIYSFEPDHNNYMSLEDYCRKTKAKNITLVRQGMYNKTGKIQFNGNGNVDSRIINKSNRAVHNANVNTIRTTTIDDYFRNKEKPTLIKMDIEGVEKEALIGASSIIRRYRPKLMISVYHHAEDLWNLPILINKLNPTYRLYLRHFTDEITDTLCYAC